MSEFTPEIDGPTLVFTGAFNPAIFHPAWFAKQGLLREEEGKADIHVVSQQVADFKLDWLRLQVTQDRFFAQANDSGHALPLRDLVAGTFAFLEHTPIAAMGINRMMHLRIRDEATWHRIGDALAPKEFWNEVLSGRPGLRSLTIEGKRPDSQALWLRLKVEPSQRIEHGVYVESNEHYVVSSVGTDRVSTQTEGLGLARRYLTLLTENWQTSQDFVLQVARNLLSRFDR